jgi:DNA-binding Xre family transcriptional regulator
MNNNDQENHTSQNIKSENSVTTIPKNQQPIILTEQYLSSLKNLSFTQRFKVIMWHRGFKHQKDLARAVGVTEFYMSHIMTGFRNGKRYRSKICEILQISEKDLWDGN